MNQPCFLSCDQHVLEGEGYTRVPCTLSANKNISTGFPWLCERDVWMLVLYIFWQSLWLSYRRDKWGWEGRVTPWSILASKFEGLAVGAKFSSCESRFSPLALWLWVSWPSWGSVSAYWSGSEEGWYCTSGSPRPWPSGYYSQQSLFPPPPRWLDGTGLQIAQSWARSDDTVLRGQGWNEQGQRTCLLSCLGGLPSLVRASLTVWVRHV